jgi:exodeoxyribonuclease VII large subunit
MMSRSLFDPDKALGASVPDPVATSPSISAAAVPANPGPLRVTQVVELIRTTLEMRTPSPLRVVGQVSNLKPNNHWYFSLKDEQSILHCVAWSTAAKKFGFVPRDGDEVVATGHLSHYGPQGKTQLYVDNLQPVGAGALELKFRALCEQLRGLGYFDEARKKPLPLFPTCVAVITSRQGAALGDVLVTAAQRCKAIKIVVVDVRVQGDGAGDELARAINWVDRHRRDLGIDAVLVTRGGGSIEDLWAFNERVVASTPTQAAMRLIPSAVELCRHVKHLGHRLGVTLARLVHNRQQRSGRLGSDLDRIVKGRLMQQRARVERAVGRLHRLRPTTQLTQRSARLAVLRDRLHRAMSGALDQRQVIAWLRSESDQAFVRTLSRRRAMVNGRLERLAAMNPEAVLQRGYSITFDASGNAIRTVHAVKSGAAIRTRVSDGEFGSVVEDGPGRKARPARGQGCAAEDLAESTDGADQLDLFDRGR